MPPPICARNVSTTKDVRLCGEEREKGSRGREGREGIEDKGRGREEKRKEKKRRERKKEKKKEKKKKNKKKNKKNRDRNPSLLFQEKDGCMFTAPRCIYCILSLRIYSCCEGKPACVARGWQRPVRFGPVLSCVRTERKEHTAASKQAPPSLHECAVLICCRSSQDHLLALTHNSKNHNN